MKSAVPPQGFRYESEFLCAEEEGALARQLAGLRLEEFDFHGHIAKRRVASFGWHYDFVDSRLRPAPAIPDFLLGVRRRAAGFAGLEAEDLAQALVTEYRPGTSIGWHRDKQVFDDVIGISLLSPCLLRLRLRRKEDAAWERLSMTLAPRSAYLLRGASRTAWEHSIPVVAALRYSVTFRTLK